MYGKTIFSLVFPNSVCTYAHGGTIGRLFKNLWRRKSTVHYYIEALFRYINQNGFHQPYMCICLVRRRTGEVFILAVITFEVFLVV